MIDNLSRSGYSVTRLSASLSGSAKWPLLKSWHSLHLGIFSRGGATAAKIYAIRANLSQEHKAFAAEMQIRAERLLGSTSSTAAEIHSKPPSKSKRLLRVFFTEQLPKRAFEAWLLREILAYNADRIAGFFRQSLYCTQKTRGLRRAARIRSPVSDRIKARLVS